MRDFCLYITNSARAAGVRDGQMMVYADAYIRTIYGLETMSSFEPGAVHVKLEAAQKAADDMNQYGRVGMQMYLEKNFNDSHRAADFNGDNANQTFVKVMAERFWLKLR